MKILVFPKDTGNPYQELLYGKMRESGDVVDYLARLTPSATLDLAMLIPRLFLCKLRGYEVLHLHWVWDFSLRSPLWSWKPLRRLIYLHYLLCLRLAKLMGYKLVWTAHNVLPHEEVFPDDSSARRELVRSADLVIAHSDRTLARLAAAGMEPARSVTIPIGSYSGIYPEGMGRGEARTKLSLPDAAFVYLNLGLIRRYKGIDDLIAAHKKMGSADSHLIIAGKCHDRELASRLRASIEGSQAAWHEGRVEDSDLQTYFAAADVVVLPFKSITTSSSALLAFSFGKAIIVPGIGDMADLPESIAYKYDPTVAGSLEKAMASVRADRGGLEQKSAAAKRYAESIRWPSIARQTREALRSLF